MELEQQFSLSWNNFHGNVSREFSSLLGSGELADVTLAVEGELLRAHRFVLAICSPYFKRMFQANPCQHPIVVLRDVSHKAMRDLLQFMYHGEVSVKREDLTSFIGTAEALQIKGLTNKETDEEEREQELTKHTAPDSGNVTNSQRRLSDAVDSIFSDDLPQTDHIELKKREIIDKIQRLNNLKRKSEEFLHNNYHFPTESIEKRPKVREKQIFKKYTKENIERTYDNQIYNDVPRDMTNYSVAEPSETLAQDHCENSKGDVTFDSQRIIDLKTECDDSDIIVTDPAVQEVSKSFDSSLGEHSTNKESLQTAQDDGGLSAIFMDLKSIVNGKFANHAPLPFAPGAADLKEHHLTTIPQKEDGKKKYPQRSCRSCWKVGKRRDTRFMCSACAMPFCKTPCFEIHLNKVMAKFPHSHSEFMFT